MLAKRIKRGQLVLFVLLVREAFAGGFVEYGEDPQEAVVRELREETGVDGRVVDLVGAFGKAGRDERRHVVTLLYLCEMVDEAREVRAGDDAAHAAFVACAGRKRRKSLHLITIPPCCQHWWRFWRGAGVTRVS